MLPRRTAYQRTWTCTRADCWPRPAPTAECPYTLTTSGKCLFLSDAYASFQGCETEVCGPASAALVCIASQAENDEVADLLEYDEA